MSIKSTALRKDLYRLLDQVLETGQPLEVERKGRRLLIIPTQAQSKRGTKKLSALVAHADYLACSADEVVHLDWSSEWKP